MRQSSSKAVLEGYEQLVSVEVWEHDWSGDGENEIVMEHLVLELEFSTLSLSTWITRALFYWRGEGRSPYVVIEWDVGVGEHSLIRQVKPVEMELYVNTLAQLTAYGHSERDFEKDFEALMKLNQQHGGRASRAVVESYYTQDGGETYRQRRMRTIPFHCLTLSEQKKCFEAYIENKQTEFEIQWATLSSVKREEMYQKLKEYHQKLKENRKRVIQGRFADRKVAEKLYEELKSMNGESKAKK